MIILAYFIKLIEIVMAIWDVFSNQMNKPSISKEDLNRLLNVADINKTEAGTLLNFRNAPENTKNIPLQNAIAPYEHRQFSRDIAANADSKLGALVNAAGVSLANPIYTSAKSVSDSVGAIDSKLKFLDNRSDASMNEVIQGWLGASEGLGKALQSNKPILPSKESFKDSVNSFNSFWGNKLGL